MTSRAKHFEMNRRDFLAASAGGAAMMALAPLSTASASAPKKGGRLSLGLSGGSTSDSLDPGTWASFPLQVGLFGGVYNNLAELDADNNAVPELAESWDASADAKTWAFRLRKDVEFHNGKTLSAQDVVASINHHRGGASTSAAKGIVEQIIDVRADGKDTVIFKLALPNVDFPFIVSDNHLVIMPEKDGLADWQSAVGTGGYNLAEFDPGVRMFLTRQSNYWKEGRAHFEEVDLLTLADTAARSNALLTGAVDAINRVDIKTLNQLRQKPGVVIEDVASNQHFTLPMFANVAPFEDNNVRMALKYAINRQALLEKILRGHGTLGNDHPIGPANRFFASDLPQREYDPDKAKHYLQKADLNSLRVDLHTADAAFSGAVDMAVLFKEYAAPAGIEINVVREPNDGYWSNVWLKKPFCMSYWGGRPTADWMFALVYAPDAPWNESRWQNKRFTALLEEARGEFDNGKRKAMYTEMQQLVRDDGSTIIPVYANFVDARSDKLAHDGKLANNQELDGWKIVERWWFA